MRRATAFALVVLALAFAASCTGSDEKEEAAQKPRIDVMYAVSDAARFVSDGDADGAWRWLRTATQSARWEFPDLPQDLTDLVTQVRVAVPSGADHARFYFSFGTGEKGSRVIARAAADLTLDPATGGRIDTASGNVTIPAEVLPTGTRVVWMEVSRTDPGGEAPATRDVIGVRKESVRFSPLRLPAGKTPATSESTTTPRVSDAAVDGATPAAALTAAHYSPATAPAADPVTFTSDGDLISGWYWLRDAAHRQRGEWTMAVPSGSTVQLNLEVLATTTYNGPRDVDARFHLSVGGIVDGTYGPTVLARLVTLPNVSPADDPVGYTTRGSVSFARAQLGSAPRLWVRIQRVDDNGGAPVSEHIAVRAESVTAVGGIGATTTAPRSTTTVPATTTTRPPGSDQVGSCDVGVIPAASFAPEPSAARGYTDRSGTRWFLLRTTLDSVSNDMPENYSAPFLNQHATWTFDELPGGTGDVRVRLRTPIRVSAVTGAPLPAHEVYLTYGEIPAPASGAMKGPVTVQLTPESAPVRQLPTGALPNQAVRETAWQDYTIYVGEKILPRADLDGAAGYWIRAALTRIGTADTWGAQVALNADSLRACAGEPDPIPAFSQPSTPAVTVTRNAADRSLTASRSIFTDVGSDIDGDGLNQNFEREAANLVNPVLVFDESEEWLANRTVHPAAILVHVRPWPSYQNPKYVMFEYLPTFAYDAGAGITMPSFVGGSRIGIESHRGDSEKIYLTYLVVDDRHLELTRVYTSAHDDGTEHNAQWAPAGTACNDVNVTVIDETQIRKYVVTEQMCGSLEFDATGRLVIYPGRDKHAMYPSKATCEAATLVRVRYEDVAQTIFTWLSGVEVMVHEINVTETCGWDPLVARSFDDTRYLGQGRWQLDVYNVGEPGNWLIDDFASPATWRGLTQSERVALTGRFPGEKVWTGRVDDGTNRAFCGGLDRIEGGDVYAGYVYTGPPGGEVACSGRLGAKYDEPPSGLLEALPLGGN